MNGIIISFVTLHNRPPHMTCTNKIENIEKERFGSFDPAPEIQSFIGRWICNLLDNPTKNKVIFGSKICILYSLEMMKNSMRLHIANIMVVNIDLRNTFKNEIQFYYQIIIKYLFTLFEIETNM